jgi:ribosomal protein S18 acetylase RimI-like enzyme
MEIRIVTGNFEHLYDCIEAYQCSELGEVYSHTAEELTSFMTQGFGKGEIFVALDETNKCLGYIWITMNGAFYGFPYCMSLAVKKDFRGRGIGTALLKYYDKIGFENSTRLFILVSDFNYRAKKFYERAGYKQVGQIPDFFKDGVSEFILVKYKKKV